MREKGCFAMIERTKFIGLEKEEATHRKMTEKLNINVTKVHE